MYFAKFNKESVLQTLLQSQEEVIWQGVSNRGWLIFEFIIFSLPILGLGSYFLTQGTTGLVFCGRGVCSTIPTTYANGAVLGLAIIAGGLFILIINFLQQFSKEYAVTSKRVLIKSGFVIAQYKSIYYEKIKELVNDTGWMGKLFGFGTVKIDTGKADWLNKNLVTGKILVRQRYSLLMTRTNTIWYDCLTAISTPDEVFQYINIATANARGISDNATSNTLPLRRE